MVLDNLIEKYYPKMKSIREYLHENPEIENNLPLTSTLVEKELQELGFEIYKGFYKTGLIGILRGKEEGKTLMLRADMDALPINELTNLPYKSKNNFMHACAHDGHTATLIGVANILNEIKNNIKGNIVFLFQPSEESNYGGAKYMIEDGVLDIIKIDASISGHLWGGLPMGVIATKKGVVMAARDEFKIIIKGKGGHGAMPSNCIDPIIVASQIIINFQNIISRSLLSNDSVVLSICEINTPPGASNIIANEITLTGTLRTFKNKLREEVLEKMYKILDGITSSYGASYYFEFTGGYPEVINDENITKIIEKAGVQILDFPMGGSEDYSHFAKLIPSCFSFIGMYEKEPIIHHNPYFQWNSEAMKIFAKFLCNSTLEYLK